MTNGWGDARVTGVYKLVNTMGTGAPEYQTIRGYTPEEVFSKDWQRVKVRPK
jgi:hypothetical protein